MMLVSFRGFLDHLQARQESSVPLKEKKKTKSLNSSAVNRDQILLCVYGLCFFMEGVHDRL